MDKAMMRALSQRSDPRRKLLVATMVFLTSVASALIAWQRADRTEGEKKAAPGG